jgi:hypothetical protein
MKTFCLIAMCSGLLGLAGLSCSKSTGSPDVGAGMKVCFQCNGTGTTKCQAAGCGNGWVDCPGPCLKLSKGTWVHMDVKDHPPTDVWQNFQNADGTSIAWNQKHVGQVIEMQNGKAVNIGNCKICNGTAHVKCSVCQGTGEVVCTLCEGKKVVPDSWTTFDNPRMKTRPSHFKLKDGRTIFGRRSMVLGNQITIRTETGSVTLDAAEIVSEETQPVEKK